MFNSLYVRIPLTGYHRVFRYLCVVYIYRVLLENPRSIISFGFGEMRLVNANVFVGSIFPAETVRFPVNGNERRVTGGVVVETLLRARGGIRLPETAPSASAALERRNISTATGTRYHNKIEPPPPGRGWRVFWEKSHGPKTTTGFRGDAINNLVQPFSSGTLYGQYATVFR